jgi:drug/metabolite transporter (DMT)-like permease
MHRHPLGNGRRLAIVAAIALVIGAALPWWVVGGDGELPARTFHAFDGSGILAFLAGLATLALVALPYAAGDRPVSVDRGLAYGLLAVVAIAGVLLWIPTTLERPEGLLPTRAYGYWLDVLGAILLARAAYDIALEPPRR